MTELEDRVRALPKVELHQHVDGSIPAENYRKIRGELESFSAELANKRELIAANKLDLAVDNDALDALMQALPDREIFAISGATRQGVESLLETIWRALREDAEAADEPEQSPTTG